MSSSNSAAAPRAMTTSRTPRRVARVRVSVWVRVRAASGAIYSGRRRRSVPWFLCRRVKDAKLRDPAIAFPTTPVVDLMTLIGARVAPPKLTKLEMQIMDALWQTGPASVREIQEALPAGTRPAYTTVQTIVARLEAKKAVRRVKKIGN